MKKLSLLDCSSCEGSSSNDGIDDVENDNDEEVEEDICDVDGKNDDCSDDFIGENVEDSFGNENAEHINDGDDGKGGRVIERDEDDVRDDNITGNALDCNDECENFDDKEDNNLK